MVVAHVTGRARRELMMKDIRIFDDKKCKLAQDASMIEGMRKLCQRFLITLLTEQGSMLYLPDRGCQFLTRIKHTVKNEFDVMVAFSSSKMKLKKSMKSAETNETPNSERYLDSSIDSLLLDDGFLIITLAVKNRSGSVAKVMTPRLLVM